MSREVPWAEDAHCDVCGQLGAYDFMGDYVCGKCLHLGEDPDNSAKNIIERWRVVHPSGKPCDFHEASRNDAEDRAIAEALTGSSQTRAEALNKAYRVGYRIVRIS